MGLESDNDDDIGFDNGELEEEDDDDGSGA
jgi:hypothetical protein